MPRVETSLSSGSPGLGEAVSLWNNRRALRSLARYDLRKNYAATAGGILWAIITPLVPILIFSAVFSLGLKLPLGRAPYIFGFASAYIPWLFLSSAITGSAGSIVEHRYLVKRIIFPVEIIPADSILVHSLAHGILMALMTIICLVAGYGHFPEILTAFYFYFCAIVFASSAGLFLASLTVVVRDVQQMLPSIMNVWFWLTPIAWSVAQFPPAGRRLLALNPAGYIVSGYRYALMPGVFTPPGLYEGVAFWAMAMAMVMIASVCFRRLRPHFWDCL